MKVFVFCGGVSSEREVSLKSGAMVQLILENAGREVVLVDTAISALGSLVIAAEDFVFLALHGGDGENGTLQNYLELRGIRYSGSGPLASALAMRKDISKKIWQAESIITPDSRVFTDGWVDSALDNIQFPAVVKPTGEGCSVGLTVVDNEAELRDSISVGVADFGRVMVEEYIQGDEYTVAILADEVFCPVLVKAPRRAFDYYSKFESPETEYVYAPDVPGEHLQAIKEAAWRAYTALECSGFGRVDIIFCHQRRKPYVLEVNTLPGMTDRSIFLQASLCAGYSAVQVMELIMAHAVAQRAANSLKLF
ncbi:D-alanine--D-alanine ligase [Pseudomonas putida]